MLLETALVAFINTHEPENRLFFMDDPALQMVAVRAAFKAIFGSWWNARGWLEDTQYACHPHHPHDRRNAENLKLAGRP